MSVEGPGRSVYDVLLQIGATLGEALKDVFTRAAIHCTDCFCVAMVTAAPLAICTASGTGVRGWRKRPLPQGTVS